MWYIIVKFKRKLRLIFMKEFSAKKTFHRIGMTYTAMTILVTLLQVLVAFVGVKVWSVENFTIDIQMLLNSAMLYVGGFLILQLGMRSMPIAKMEKHSMSVVELIQAFCMCYAILIASNLLGQFVTTWIGLLRGTVVENPVEVLTSEISMPVLVLLTVICAPVFEELFFRKFLIDKTVMFGELPAILLYGFLFGLFHGNLSQFPYAFALGVLFGFLYVRTGKIRYTMILHAFINSFGAVISSFILEQVSMEEITALVHQMMGMELLETTVSPNAMIGLAALAVLEVMTVLFVLAGIILWILCTKKICLYTREQDIPRGQRMKTVLGNWGMVLYMLIWIAMILYNL